MTLVPFDKYEAAFANRLRYDSLVVSYEYVGDYEMSLREVYRVAGSLRLNEYASFEIDSKKLRFYDDEHIWHRRRDMMGQKLR